MTLSIVFVTYESARDLEQCLASLDSTYSLPELDLLVVDNGSSDRSETSEICARWGARFLPLRRNVGYGAAANRAVSWTDGDYVAVANPDLVFLPDTLRRLAEFMEEHPAVGVVAPQQVYPDGTCLPSARRYPALRYVLSGRRSVLRWLMPRAKVGRAFLYEGVQLSTSAVPVEAVVGGLMLFRRQAFLEVGGFDERFFMFAEDLDICRRLRDKWGIFLLPTARIVHVVGSARRRRRLPSEFHRVRSLRLFMLDNASSSRRVLIALLAVAYLSLSAAATLVDLAEPEYSWRQSRSRP